MRELDPVNLRGHFEEFRKTHTMRRCTRCATLPLRFPRFEALCDQENLLMVHRGMACCRNVAIRLLAAAAWIKNPQCLPLDPVIQLLHIKLTPTASYGIFWICSTSWKPRPRASSYRSTDGEREIRTQVSPTRLLC